MSEEIISKIDMKYEFKAKITDINENEILSEKILNFYLQKDRFSISDVLSFTINGNLYSKAKFVRFYMNGIQIFAGIVDSQKSVFDQKGRHTTLVCRNKSALLLDNEVEPKIHINLTATKLFKDFAQPLGISGSDLPSDGVASQITAYKGMSYWEFIESYCLKVYKKKPYIENNRIKLDVLTDKEYFFSNDSENGIGFSGISICDERYNALSKVKVRRTNADGEVDYGYTITNNTVVNYGITRERYYNCKESDLQAYAVLLIKEKQLDFFEIEVQIETASAITVGDSCSVEQDGNTYSNMYVSQVKVYGDSKGCRTKIKLWHKTAL